MDGTGHCVKNIVVCAVLLEKVVIHSLEDFACYADSNIKCFFVNIKDKDFIREIPYVESMWTLKVHMVKSLNTKARFYYLHFFKIATYDNEFYTQWYCRSADFTNPYGHMDLPLQYAVNETCASCFWVETGGCWICCPLCSQ